LWADAHIERYGAIQKSEHAATIATLTATGTGMIGLRAKSDK
jgi:hypothetical protein